MSLRRQDKKGVAQSLLTTIIENAKQNEVLNIFLETRSDNYNAQKPYLKNDFVKQNNETEYDSYRLKI
ncbi:MAG: GNAT family N-acetyltransferase [Flavobacteriaceae bacterium]|nr:GNAT family N-acetyltransferase [Flavobacteriaceae bacterium]